MLQIKGLSYVYQCISYGLDQPQWLLRDMVVLKEVLFCKRRLKPFVRQVPVGREGSLIIRLQSKLNRGKKVSLLWSDTTFIRIGCVFAFMAGQQIHKNGKCPF